MAFEQDIERVFAEAGAIKERVAELGDKITRDYAGREITMIGLLTGAVTFMADLARQIRLPVYYEFMSVSSYGQSSVSSGQITVKKDVGRDVAGRHIILVDDIADTGLTLNYTATKLAGRKPASLKICAFLDKPARRETALSVDYTGFTAPDEFLVGYGLDYAQKYRNLPYVGILKKSVYNKP
ncbi:MAG: hypoxanthine phosphoribosyltransferase [Acidaminococcales bacterium]|jgi:hypoxanthine phosphoribosyltransferase|nr:hypoxanthine phosphoribosyltransferase [Acidaminococcales bacterium]